nr:immunoglobulin heavy chain junction region [Mus musculus]
CVREFPFAYW